MMTKRLFAILLALLLLAPTASAVEAEDPYPYGMSDWAREDVEKAMALMPEHSWYWYMDGLYVPIDRSNFAVIAASVLAIEFGSNIESYLLIMNYRGEALNDEPFYLNALDVAKNLDIIQGREDGDWDWYSFITRQEAAVMLARTYRAYHDTVPDVLQLLSFTDQDKIADWAMDDVQLMNQLGIMTGVTEDLFDPLGHYTIEQCLVTLMRLHEKAPYDGSKQENPFTIPEWEGDFFKVFEKSRTAFAIETEDYYICCLDYSSELSDAVYNIKIIDQDFSLRSYQSTIFSWSSFRGSRHAKPQNPAISEDGTKLTYTATVEEDAYQVYLDIEGNPEKTLLFLKGIYTVTMDLETGEQTYTRADLIEG